jgi:hypothetical protein
MQQRTRLMSYKESVVATTRVIEGLRHESDILCSGAHLTSEQDHELQEVYRHPSNVEHGWNHTHMLLDITHDEVDIRTHRIIHLEHHVEAQDVNVKERAEMIANLEQQLLEHQVQATSEPVDPEEIDAMSGIDEDLVLSM